MWLCDKINQPTYQTQLKSLSLGRVVWGNLIQYMDSSCLFTSIGPSSLSLWPSCEEWWPELEVLTLLVRKPLFWESLIQDDVGAELTSSQSLIIWVISVVVFCSWNTFTVSSTHLLTKLEDIATLLEHDNGVFQDTKSISWEEDTNRKQPIFSL